MWTRFLRVLGGACGGISPIWTFFVSLRPFSFSYMAEVKKKLDINGIKTAYGIVGLDSKLDYAIQIALQVAPTDLSVLITGENGVGKEKFPKIIHDHSSRKRGPYLAINCGAIPEGTMDSELFGHEKGAFTGADNEHAGYFEQANGGTIFLDEVGDLPMSTQVRLLRVLETGEYRRMESNEVRKTDVRIVAATNVNMNERIAQGRFREDLYYRLNAVPIQIPALRDRCDDIPLLMYKFVTDMSLKYSIPPITITEEAIEVLKRFPWPGNIRQLKHVSERIAVMEESREITATVLSKYLGDSVTHLPAVIPTEHESQSFDNFKKDVYYLLKNMGSEISDLKAKVERLENNRDQQPFVAPMGNIALDASNDVPQIEIIQPKDQKVEDALYDTSEVIEEEDLNLEKMRKKLIQKALAKHHGNREAAAKDLGVSTRTLYRDINTYQL